MNEKETIILTVAGEEEVRLDKYLADVVEDQSRASIQRLMEAGEVRSFLKTPRRNPVIEWN